MLVDPKKKFDTYLSYLNISEIGIGNLKVEGLIAKV